MTTSAGRPTLPDVSGRLAGRVAVVTGAGASGAITGTGRAISEVFAAAGATVVVVDRDADAAQRTVAAIEAAGGSCTAEVADVGSEADCMAAAERVASAFGRVDVLVNNVGIDNKSGRPKVCDIGLDDWHRMMDVNAGGALLMWKYCIPLMPDGGSIIHISSTAAVRPGPDAAYAASKGALEHLSLAIASQYGEQQVRSNVIRPGEIWTSLIATSFTDEDLPVVRQKRIDRTLLQEEGTAYDIATAALFFAGDDARWITGQVLTVDGGTTLYFDRSYHPRVHWQFDHR